MLNRITRLQKARRSRHGSTSPLLLSAKHMEVALAKERMRCDRYQQFFALIAMKLEPSSIQSEVKQARHFARILHKRLRLTDEKGWLRDGRIGAMLPMTNLHGAKLVLNSLIEMAHANHIKIEASVFTYSGVDNIAVAGQPHRPNFALVTDDSSDDHTQSNDEDEGNDQLITFRFEGSHHSDGVRPAHVVIESASESAPIAKSQSVRLSDTTRPVRADDASQISPLAMKNMSMSDTEMPMSLVVKKYPTWKRLTDIAGAVVGLTIASPVLLGAAIAIKLTSKGPVLFKQMRTGQFGRQFPIYKLRTMVVNAEELKAILREHNERDGPAFKMARDPRVTRVGKILRSTGLDELPQLWNVLIGDMAIVGPRPLPCDEDAQCAVWHRRRLDTKPGLTCTWQISKSRKVSFEDWMRMDLRYSDRRSIARDVSLVLKTVMAVVLGRVGH